MKSTIVALLLSASVAYSQDLQPAAAKSDTMPSPWKHTMIVSMNITQVSFTDWAQGGENALAYALFLEGKSLYTQDIITWENSYKLGYGQAKLGSQGIRKTDDRIDFESVLTYKMGAYINPYASASLKTQFVEGVKYDATGIATPVSNFFDPAYITQSAGFSYQPAKEVKTRLGVGLREIVTKSYTAYSDGKQVEVDGGFESVTEVGWTVMANVVLNAKLELFAPVKQIDQMMVRSDNTLAAKINKFLSVNLNVQLINDPKVQARTQIEQTLALGVNFTLQ
jgi:Protein of unknown function (DUF3078)